MRLNKDTQIIGTNVILVPYKKLHVPKYHKWMQSEELRALTSSEPLSVEEEFEMQHSWALDEDKCTFIILDKEIYMNTNDEISSMIGDTNFFFANPDDRICAEAEIMIAESSSRGKRRGWEAMLHMLLYGVQCIKIKQFMVKIAKSNQISKDMFQKMGFIQTEESNVFNEVTLEKVVDPDWVEWIVKQLPTHTVIDKSQ